MKNSLQIEHPKGTTIKVEVIDKRFKWIKTHSEDLMISAKKICNNIQHAIDKNEMQTLEDMRKLSGFIIYTDLFHHRFRIQVLATK